MRNSVFYSAFLLHTSLYVIYDFAYALPLGVMFNLSPVCFVLCFI